MTVSGHLHVIKHTIKLNSLPHKKMSINKLMGIFIAFVINSISIISLIT